MGGQIPDKTQPDGTTQRRLDRGGLGVWGSGTSVMSQLQVEPLTFVVFPPLVPDNKHQTKVERRTNNKTTKKIRQIRKGQVRQNGTNKTRKDKTEDKCLIRLKESVSRTQRPF